MKGQGKKFSWRGWTTFVTTISFIVDLLSGIILYIAPPGRVANALMRLVCPTMIDRMRCEAKSYK